MIYTIGSAHDPWYLKKGAKPSEKKRYFYNTVLINIIHNHFAAVLTREASLIH